MNKIEELWLKCEPFFASYKTYIIIAVAVVAILVIS